MVGIPVSAIAKDDFAEVALKLRMDGNNAPAPTQGATNVTVGNTNKESLGNASIDICRKFDTA